MLQRNYYNYCDTFRFNYVHARSISLFMYLCAKRDSIVEINIYLYINTHTHTRAHLSVYIYIYIYITDSVSGTPCIN